MFLGFQVSSQVVQRERVVLSTRH